MNDPFAQPPALAAQPAVVPPSPQPEPSRKERKVAAKATAKAAKQAAKAKAAADRAAAREVRHNERIIRAELRSRQADGFTFHDDGTVEYKGMFGSAKPRATLLDAIYLNDRHNKPAVGRAAGALLTGGVSLLATSGRTGGCSVQIITDSWTHKINADGDTNDLSKLYGLALQAKARAQR